MKFLVPNPKRQLGARKASCKVRQKDRVEEGLFDRRRDLFTEVELVLFDTTSHLL